MKRFGFMLFSVVAIVLIYAIGSEDSGIDLADMVPPTPVDPNWDAIAAWPPDTATQVDAVPDPNRNFTAIVFDDSGSMGGEIADARTAVVTALESMGDTDRVTVIALNAGEVIPFMSVADARAVLPAKIADVAATGSTPLTKAVSASRAALAQEAAVAGGFGTYRILVTTDGAADRGDELEAEIENIAAVTPIQIATIGVGITGRHVLSRSDLAAFVSINDVSQLAEALKNAIAEEQNFSAITSFGDQ